MGSIARGGDRPDPGVRPSMELLEFLGEWQTEKGEWVDPVALESMNLSATAASEDEHDDGR